MAQLGTGLWNRVLIDATRSWKFERRPEWGGERFPPTVRPAPEDEARVRAALGGATGSAISEMKITEVRAIPLAIPLRAVDAALVVGAPAPASRSSCASTTDEGLIGWGECFAYGAPLAVCNVVDDALAPLVLGQDPTQIESVVDRMHRALMIWGRRGLGDDGGERRRARAVGPGRQGARRTGLRAAGRPRASRGPARTRAFSATSTPAQVRAGGVGRRRAGLHGDQAPPDRRRVGRRRARGGRQRRRADARHELSVDASRRRFASAGSSSASTSAGSRSRSGRRRTTRGWLACAPRCGIPIAAGENDATAFGFRELIAAGAADIVQPSVTKVGGLVEMKKIATLAAAANVTLVPHSFYFGPGLAATLHFVAVDARRALRRVPADRARGPAHRGSVALRRRPRHACRVGPGSAPIPIRTFSRAIPTAPTRPGPSI